VLLISDLHLEPGREDITASLLHLLRHRALDTDKLLVLGDLFEVWVGDDEDSPLASRIADEFNRLHDSGVEIWLMHGNRDFLLGQDYAERCGAGLLAEPYVFEHQDQRIALMHGDLLCSDDTEYQKFRQMVRDPQWQQEFLAQPLADRQAYARKVRERSMQDNRHKTTEIMDVNAGEVNRSMQALSVTTLIHGHTHRPAVHDLQLAGGAARRIVLGDWDKQGWLVEIDDRGINLEAFPLQAVD
jgi:UDP-2,3-diacylglucosamine hydrolase